MPPSYVATGSLARTHCVSAMQHIGPRCGRRSNTPSATGSRHELQQRTVIPHSARCSFNRIPPIGPSGRADNTADEIKWQDLSLTAPGPSVVRAKFDSGERRPWRRDGVYLGARTARHASSCRVSISRWRRIGSAVALLAAPHRDGGNSVQRFRAATCPEIHARVANCRA